VVRCGLCCVPESWGVHRNKLWGLLWVASCVNLLLCRSSVFFFRQLKHQLTLQELQLENMAFIVLALGIGAMGF
jgi:hypothetical protein